MTMQEMKCYCDVLSKIRVKCSCSHTLYFPSFGPDIQICSHCGKKVYRNERVKFKSMMLKKINGKEAL